MLNHHALSDIGKGRANNEDYFLVDESHHLFILADGIGGHNFGEVASKKACEVVKDKFHHVLSLSPIQDLETAVALVKFAIYSANRAVYQMALDDPTYTGMGTTLLVVFKYQSHLLVGHVGDSRCYQSHQSLDLLTEDHTLFIPKSPKSRSLRSKHYLTKSVGLSDFIDPSVSIHPYNPEATYLLCSDGLSDYLDTDTIHGVLKQPSNLELKAQILLKTALDTEARDNITFILMKASSTETG